MTTIINIKAIWALSLGVWGLLLLYTSFRVRRFIVKRYETETDLLNTVYFRKHATFTKGLPTLISSPLYIAHLVSFLWGWNYFKNRKPYKDIEDANVVKEHFSKNEIRLVKSFVIIGLIVILHCAFYSMAELVYPWLIK